MTKRKRRNRSTPRVTPWRPIALGVVVVAVAAIVWFKVAGNARMAAVPLDIPTGEPQSGTPVATAAAGNSSVGGENEATDDDPLPADPAGQVDWIIRNKRPAMILFHSLTCIPCKAMEELVSKVRSDYEPEIVFIDVVTDDRNNWPLLNQAQIRTIPTSFFILSSGEGKRAIGAMGEAEFRAELDALLEGTE